MAQQNAGEMPGEMDVLPWPLREGPQSAHAWFQSPELWERGARATREMSTIISQDNTKQQ